MHTKELITAKKIIKCAVVKGLRKAHVVAYMQYFFFLIRCNENVLQPWLQTAGKSELEVQIEGELLNTADEDTHEINPTHWYVISL